MAKRVDKLTPEQESMMAAHADKWIEIGLRTGATDLDAFTEGAKRCYEAAGLTWPGVVVRVPSPLVMAFAGPVAALVIEMHEKGITPNLGKTAVGDAVGGAVGGAVDGAVDGAVRGAVDGAVDGAVGDAVGGAVDGAVGGAVRGAVRDAVRDAVRGAVGDAVGDAVRDAVDGAVGGAVDGAVGDALAPESELVIRGAVGRVIGQSGNRYVGYYWWTYWQAWSTFFRDHTDLELSGDLWDRSRAYEQCTESAGHWWPHRNFVMVCDSPVEIHREQIGARGWGSHRLHNESGPSISWIDGWALYHVHGVRVTEQIIMRPETITVDQVLKESNAEVRRVMIERMPGGWLGFAESAGLTLIDECPDPANAPNVVRLFELPLDIRDVLGTPVRLITCRNATPERDGTIRDFGLTCPVEMTKALDAVAWTFGTDAETYSQLARAT